MNSVFRCALCALVWVLSSHAIPARSQTLQPAFEVASVKPNKTGEQGGGLGMSPNGRFMATNVTLKQLITNAYNLRGFQVTGGPAWLDVDRFDISATVGQPSPD